MCRLDLLTLLFNPIVAFRLTYTNAELIGRAAVQHRQDSEGRPAPGFPDGG